MNSLRIMGIGVLTLSMFFAMAAVIPSFIEPSVGVTNAYASSGGGEKECMTASSALFFENRMLETTYI